MGFCVPCRLEWILFFWFAGVSGQQSVLTNIHQQILRRCLKMVMSFIKLSTHFASLEFSGSFLVV